MARQRRYIPLNVYLNSRLVGQLRRDLAGAIAVRVSVHTGWLSMGGPSGVPDAFGTLDARGRALEGLYPDLIFEYLDALAADGYSRGIIAPVLQLFQGIYQDRIRPVISQVTNYSAHYFFLLA